MRNSFRTILLWTSQAIALFLLVSCGGSGSSHPLAGTWLGYWFVGDAQVTFNSQGTMTEFLRFGDPVGDFSSGEITGGGPEAYRMSLDFNSIPYGAWYLVDGEERHALFATDPDGVNDPYFIGALEKGAESLPIYGEDDIIGFWSGYALFYSDQAMDAAIEPTMSLSVVSGSPDNSFSLTLPNGSIIIGSFDNVLTSIAIYSGSAIGGWTVTAYMTPDKQFIALRAEQDPGDLFLYALNREP